MDTLTYRTCEVDTPVIPLPNPGEGGPVAGGPSNGNEGIPVIPLPNPGEGGPVANGPSNGNEGIPMIPLPNPGEGGPIPDFNYQPGGILGSIITVFPRPIIPCYFCNATQSGTVRFLNTAAGYNAFIIYINNQMVVTSLDNGEVSQYGRVSSGLQTVTVAGQNGYIYIQKQVNVPMNSAITVAIINTASGLDLMVIQDMDCNGGISTGCFRVCNLSSTNRSVNVFLNGGAVVFQDVNYQEVTRFRYLASGNYTVQVANNPSYTGISLVNSSVFIRGNVSYTMYVFNWNLSQDAIRTLIVEDRRS